MEGITSSVAEASPDAAGPVTINPNGMYDVDAVAAVFGITRRTLGRWRRDRRKRFPAPFYPGGAPRWMGRALLTWANNRQAEVLP